jgi:hypothetical protein
MMQFLHMASFVSGLSDLSQAIQKLDPDQYAWSQRMFDKAVDLIRTLPCDGGHVGIGIHPLDFDDESWCYCMQHTHVAGMNELTLHYDVNVTDTVDAGIQVDLRLQEPDPEHAEDRIERGSFRLHSRKRRFYLYWYGKIFETDAERSASEHALLDEMLRLARLDLWSFHGEVSVTQRNAFRMIRTFVQFMKAGSTS